MNKQSNTYIVTYATVLVVVVAAVLSFAAIKLQPMQEANVKIEKMGAILGAIGKGAADTTVADKNLYIERTFGTYITKTLFVDSLGNAVEAPAEEVLSSLNDLPAVFEAKAAMPVFVATLSDHTTEYVVPMTGKGLWGPVWGYMALNDDCNTVAGAVFDHKGETPGLGAEITTAAFQGQFVGKQLFKDGKFESIDLLKGAGASVGNAYAVDAISGGTLTSNGVKAMLRTCLGDYVPFFEKVQAEEAAVTPVDTVAVAATIVDSTAMATDSLVMTENTEGGAK